MVAVVSGSGLGLTTSSLGSNASSGGSAALGQNRERIFVNSTTGNLVIQSRDEALSAAGLDNVLVRTYNSQGVMDDDNGDNWRLNVQQRVYGLTGTVNTAGSTVRKTFGDGAEVVYTYNTTLGKYVATVGDDAHDTLSYSTGTAQWTWTEGSSRLVETYNANGQLITSKDADGNTVTYAYTGHLLTQITDASGQVTYLDYTGRNLTQVRVVSNSVTQTLTRYAYDSLGRLSTVTVDLTPADNSIADAKTYVTTYTYDSTSRRVASITQSDGTTIAFTYQLLNGAYRLKTYTDGLGKVTTFNYSTVSTAATTGAWNAAAAQLDTLATAASDPKIAYSANGNALAVWAQGSDLFYSAYTQSTNAWNVPAALDTLGAAVGSPSLAVDAAGNAVIAWVQSNGTANSLYSAIYSAAAGTMSAPALLESTNLAVDNASGSVVTSINGGVAAVAWLQTDGTRNNFYAARWSGAAWSAPALIETGSTAAAQPAIAVNAQGNVTVLWQQSDATAISIWSARFNGSAWSAPATIETSTAGAYYPQIVFDSAGNGFAIWSQGSNATVSRYTASTNTWAAPIALDSLSNAVTGATISMDAAGNALAAWAQSNGTAVSAYTTRYDAASGTWGAVTLVESTNLAVAGTPGALVTAINGPFAAVAWLQTDGTRNNLYAARYDGSAWSAATPLETSSNAAAQPSIAIDNKGSVSVLWQQSDGTANSIFQTRYNSATPAQSTYLTTDVVDPLSRTTTYTQDSSGRLTSVQSPTVGGVRLRTDFTYDADGNVLTVTEDSAGLNRVTTMAYDANGNLLSTGDSAGNTVTRTYSATHRLVTETRYGVPDPDGAGSGQPGTPLTTRYAYDGEEHLRFVISADGRVTEHRYNTAGQRIASLVFVGGFYNVGALSPTTTLSEPQLATWVATQDLTRIQRTDYAYDFRGNLSTVTAFTTTDSSGAGQAAGASVARYVYDQRGQLITQIDPRGETTTGDPNDFVTSYAYDGLGRTLSTTSWIAAGVTTSATTLYEDSNKRFTTTSANGLVSTTVYDQTGAIVSVIDTNTASQALGTTTYAYDAAGQLRMSTDPTGVKNYLLYDEAGRKVGAIDGDGTLTQYVYDRANQIIKTVVYSSRLTAATLATLVDAQGKPTAVTLATLIASLAGVPGRNAVLDQISRAVYDTAGRRVYDIDPIGAVTQYFYDGASRITDVVAYKNTVTIAASVDQVLPAGVSPTLDAANDRRTRNFYDNDGHLLGTLDAAGFLVEYLYDNAGRLTQQIGYANLTNSTYWLTGTLTQLRPATDTETIVDPERDIVSFFFYDNRGNRVGVLDAEGHLTETIYNEANLAIQVSRYNQVLSYTAGNSFASLKATISGASTVHSTAYVYDGLGRKTQETDYEGTATVYVYDAVGNLTSSTRANGTGEARKSQATYDALGRVLRELTPEGSAQITGGMTQPQIDAVWNQYAVTHVYDLSGRRISSADQNGNKTLFYYDVDGRITHTVNARGEVTESRYNALNQLSDVIRYATRISTTGLTGGLATTAFTNLVVANAAADTKTTYTYTLTGRIATETTAEGGLTTYSYTRFGEIDTRTVKLDATRNTVHSYVYDKRGLATLTRWDPAGINATDTRVYDAFGRVKSSTDQYSNQTRAEYDRLGRVITTYSGLNSKHVTTYDAFSRVLTSVDALNNTTAYVYNDTTRSVVLTTPEGISVTTVRNRHGQTLTVTAGGNTTTYGYDANGQLASVSDTLGTLESRLYDKAGRQTSATDARGTITAFGYDAANRVLTRTVDGSGLNLVTTYVYDALGRITQVTEPGNNVTATAYDRDGRVTQIAVDPSGLNLRTTYAYDNSGNIINVTEGYGSANPRRVQYVYDVLGRRTDEYVDAASMGGTLNLRTQYKYDANGNVTRTIDARGYSTWYVYDADQRLTHTIDALGGVTQTMYDAENRIVGIKRYANAISPPSAGTDRVTTVTVNANAALDRLEQTVYDRDGRAAYSIDAGYGVTERTFDALGNVVRERAYRTAVAATTYSSTAQLTGALTTAGNSLSSVHANDRIQWFAYDVRGQKNFSVDGAGAVTQFTYDAAGNVTQTKQFATVRSTSLATDLATLQAWATANANSGDRTTRYWYDAANRERFVLDAEGYLNETRYLDASRAQIATVYAAKPTIAAGAALASVESAAATVANASLDQGTRTEYDAAGRAIKLIDADQKTEYYGYDAVGNRTSFTNKKGASAGDAAYTWNYIYDANGRLLEERSPQVLVTTITVNGVALQSDAATASPASVVTRMTYDALGNVLTRTEGVRRFSSGTESATGSRVTTYTYDELGRQTRTDFPAVNVYNAAGDNLVTNSGNAIAPAETLKTLFSTVAYDTLGNAFRSQDVAGNFSFKVYDALGRVTYEVDAENYLTAYTYDLFGNQLTLTRHANKLTSALPTGSASLSAGDITSRLSADAAKDRTITTQYDRLNRVVQVTQPAVHNYETYAGMASAYTIGATTLSEYNAFGQVMRERRLAVASTTTHADTYHYYDRRGLKTATLDPLKYLTTFEYDETGDLKRQVEYARPVTGTPSTSSYGTLVTTTPSANPNHTDGYDRETQYQYDRLNRKISETRINVEHTTLSGSTTNVAISNQTTTFAYDALGNQTAGTVNGATTYTYYDVLGRVIAIAEPTRDAGNGANLTPLTLMRRDAYGNLVETVQYLKGAASIPANGSVPTAAVTDPSDRTTRTLFDAHGHAVRTEDAQGYDRFASYTERGELAKEWQKVTNPNDSSVDALVTVYQYDKLGRQTAVVEPKQVTGTPAIATAQTKYNAFGEVEFRGLNGNDFEYFEYDKAGRLWRTNGGDGVVKVYAYDLAGRVTAEIKSQTVNLKTAVANAGEALALSSANQMRTETVYDLLGRILEQREASFAVANPLEIIEATFQFGSLTVPNPPNAIYQLIDFGGWQYYLATPAPWAQGGGYYQIQAPSSTNPNGVYGRVAQASYSLGSAMHIYWTEPAELGLTKTFEYRSGGGAWTALAINTVTETQIGVNVSGLTGGNYEYRVNYTRVGDASPFAGATGTFAINQSTVTSLSVSQNPATSAISLMGITQQGSNTVFNWFADPTAAAKLEIMLAGTSTWQSYTPTLVNIPEFGLYYYSASAPTAGGTHQYRITHTRNGGVTVALGTGTFTVTNANTTTSGSNAPTPPWAQVSQLAATGSSSVGNPSVTLSWTATWPDNYFSYKPVGAPNTSYVGGYATTSGGVAYGNIASLAPGSYNFIMQSSFWMPEFGFQIDYISQGVIQVTTSGATITSIAAYPGFQPVTGAGSSFTPGPTVYSTTLSWPQNGTIPGFLQFQYRPVGGTWSYPAVSTSGGYHSVNLSGLSGTYEYQVSYTEYFELGGGIYIPTTTATGQFVAAGASSYIASQTNWSMYSGGTSASYLSGVSVSGSQLNWSGALQPGDTMTVTYTNTSTGATGSLTPQTSNGTNYSASFYGLASGSYTYKISYFRAGVEYLRGSGTLSITTTTTPPAASGSNPTTPGQIAGFADFGASLGYLFWSTLPAGGASVVFRYKTAGASGWAGTLPAFAVSGGYAVNVSTLSGAIDYEVTYTQAGASTPYMIGSGTTTIVRTTTTTGSTASTSGTTFAAQVMTPKLTQTFDRWGGVLSLTDAVLKTTNYRYNQYGQLIEQQLPTAAAIVSTAGGAVSTTGGRATSRNYYDLFGRLIATRDGNGNLGYANYNTPNNTPLNRVEYNAANQLIAETHADAGVKRYVYDAFGQQIQITDELGYRTRNVYDRAGQLTTTAQEITAGAFTSADPTVLTPGSASATRAINYQYDDAGRRTSETNGELMDSGAAQETTRYWYDLHGNVVRRDSARGRSTAYEYDLQQRKTKETDAIGGYQTWGYDDFGRVTAHRDLGAVNYSYGYDAESKLLSSHTSTGGQNIGYEYDAAGHLTRINDIGVNRQTEYGYDVAGRRIRERTVIEGREHQDTHLAYDELGRVAQLSDLRYTERFSYDAAGNRTNVNATYFDHGGTQRTEDLWYTYDAMNRVDIGQGAKSGNSIIINSTQGVDMAYDAKGQRTSALAYGEKLTIVNGWDDSLGFPIPITSYSKSAGYNKDIYRYDGLGRLVTTHVEANTVTYPTYGSAPVNGTAEFLTNQRVYDKASRETQSSDIAIESGAAVTRGRTSAYDDDGRIKNQTTTKNSVKESFVVYGDSVATPAGSYTYFDPFTGLPQTVSWPAGWTAGFDAAGNLRGYVVSVYNTVTSNPDDIKYTSTYQITYRSGESYQESGQSVTSTSGGPQSGATSRTYNVNGELVQFTDSRDQTKNRYFANGANGAPLTVVQGQYDGQSNRLNAAQAFTQALNPGGPYNTTKAQHFFFANGEQVGSFGQLTENGQFAANFDTNFTPISPQYPASVPSEVVVQTGETLRSIAARVFGDSTLWYVIAEENGLSDPNAQLEAGSVLRIPNEVVSLSNTASSFKPFDVSQAIGDTTPTQPMPAPRKKGGCGVIGQILMVVVAIVVTVYTAGLATGATSGVWSAGMGALSGAASGGLGAVGASIVGGAAGSIASQGVAIAAGIQDGFDWKGVALGAIGAGVGAGLGASSAFGNTVSRITQGNQYIAAGLNAAAGNALTQGIAVVTGLQQKFDWKSVAISAVSAPLAKYLGDKAGFLVDRNYNPVAQYASAGKFASDVVGSFTRAGVRTAFGGKFEIENVLADAFGNAIGNSVVGAFLKTDALQIPTALQNSSRAMQDAYRHIIRGNRTPNEALAILRNEDVQQLIGQRQELNDAAREQGFSSFEEMPHERQADIVDRVFRRGQVFVGSEGRPNWEEVAFEQMPYELPADRDSWQFKLGRGAANAVITATETINSAVEFLGEDNVTGAILAAQFALGGIPKTLIGLAVGPVADQLLEPVKHSVSGFIAEHGFDARSLDEVDAVRPASDITSSVAVGLAASTLGAVAGATGIRGIMGAVRRFRDARAAAAEQQLAIRYRRMEINPDNDFGPLNRTTSTPWIRPSAWRLPVNGGTWNGTVGDSSWHSTLPGVIRATGGRPIIFRNGYPDFSPFETRRYEFDNLRGTGADIQRANARLAEDLGLPSAEAARRWVRQQDLTWHHNEDMITLQLVPTVINDIPHQGGAQLLRQRALGGG